MSIQSMQFMLPQIHTFFLLKTDVGTMCGNTWLTYTQKACVPHYQLLLKWTVGTMSRVIPESCWETLYDWGVIDTDIHK